MNSQLKGYMLGIVAAASYGTNPLFAIPLYRAGMTPDCVLFLRYLVALPMLLGMILYRRGSLKVTRGQGVTLAVLGMLVAVSSLTLFLSYRYMDVGIASTILFVYPIMVAVMMAAFFRERAGWVTVMCMAMATAGIGLLMRGGDGAMVSVPGVMLVIASGLSYAIYIVAVNKSSIGGMSTLAVTFYVLLFGVVLFIGSILVDESSSFGDINNPLCIGCVVGLALFPTAISFACTNGAIQLIGSTPTAILGAFEPVTAVVIGVWAFGETLTLRIFAGMVLIIAAVIMVIARDRISGKRRAG